MVLLSTLSGRKEVLSMEGTFFDFLLSVFASVAGYYICKWKGTSDWFRCAEQ